MDIVAYRKKDWVGMSWIEVGLRIEHSNLLALNCEKYNALKDVYKHKAANHFLAKFEAAVYELEPASSSIKKVGTA